MRQTMPYSKETEESLIASSMIDTEALSDILDIVTEKDFFVPAFQKIFKAIKTIHKHRQPVDLITVCDQLKVFGDFEEVGGASGVSKILDSALVAPNPVKYAHMVSGYAALRRIVSTSYDIIRECNSGGNPEDILGTAQKKILEIGLSQSKDAFFDMEHLVSDALDRYEAVATQRKERSLKTGLRHLDRNANISGSKLIIVAGRPGMGKTGWAITVARHMAYNGIKVGFLSIEMDKEEIADRLFAMETGIPVDAATKQPGITDAQQWETYNATGARMARLPILLDDSGSVTIEDVERKCRKLKKAGCEAIFIDQLSKIKGRPRQSDFERFSENCNRICDLKKELRVPIFLLSQLNRKLEERADKEPILSDLKNTGSLEEDADIVILLFRPEYYEKDERKLHYIQGKAIMNIAKNRQGTTWRDKDIRFDSVRTQYFDGGY